MALLKNCRKNWEGENHQKNILGIKMKIGQHKSRAVESETELDLLLLFGGESEFIFTNSTALVIIIKIQIWRILA